jgi:hypothetical protein
VIAWLVLGIVAFEVDEVDEKTCLLVPRGYVDVACDCLLVTPVAGGGFEDGESFKDAGGDCSPEPIQTKKNHDQMLKS